MTHDERERELKRLNERIDAIANWLIQGRGNEDALRMEMRQWQEKRDRLLKEKADHDWLHHVLRHGVSPRG